MSELNDDQAAPGHVICLCCGYDTLEERSIYDICPICFWEDDPVQAKYPDSPVGANPVSLHQARANFAEFGACEREMLPHVRPPNEQDRRAALQPPASGAGVDAPPPNVLG